MKSMVSFALLICVLPVLAFATQITLKEDADLVGENGQVLAKIKAEEKFRFDRIEGDWVYGSYYHDAGVARGKVDSDAFKEQLFLRRKSIAFRREMEAKGLVKYEGNWIPIEEKERLDNESKGLVLHEGQWMTPEERDELIARAAEEQEEPEKDPLVEDPFAGVDETDPDDPLAGDEPEEEDPGEIVDPFAEEPEIEDLTGEGSEGPEETDDPEETSTRKGIDWDKATKNGKDAESASSLSPDQFSKYFLPGMIGMGIILVLIVVLSARKGSRG